MKIILVGGLVGLAVILLFRRFANAAGASTSSGSPLLAGYNGGNFNKPNGPVQMATAPPVRPANQDPTSAKGGGPSACEQLLDAGANAYAKGANLGNNKAVQTVHKAECYL